MTSYNISKIVLHCVTASDISMDYTLVCHSFQPMSAHEMSASYVRHVWEQILTLLKEREREKGC